MSEEEILKQLTYYIKVWHKGGFISGGMREKLNNLMFYKDWEIAGIATKSTRQRLYLIKKFGKCQNPACGSTVNLEQDHIVPKSKGGSDGLFNKQLLCRKCNRLKGNYLPRHHEKTKISVA